MSEPATPSPVDVSRDGLPLVRAHHATIRDALRTIDSAGMNGAVAVDADGMLVGMVTDGDIRRALLRGADLDAPVQPHVNAHAVVAGQRESRAAILDLMRARGVSLVPVIDDQSRVIAVHTLRGLLGKQRRSNLALILAGGRGTRLWPLTEHVPKPMIHVAGRPILDRIVTHLVGYGIENIYLSIGYLGERIEEYFGDGSDHGCRITYLREDPDEPLDSGGPIANLSEFADVVEPVLVMNGDLVTQFDVSAFLDHHAATGSAISIAVTTHSYEVPYGVLAIDERGTVTALVEKPIRDELVSAGMYVVSPHIVAALPGGRPFPITELIERCVDGHDQVSAWRCDPGWVDVGQPSDLFARPGRDVTGALTTTNRIARNAGQPVMEVEQVVARLDDILAGRTGVVALHEPAFHGNEWSYVKECIDTGWVSTAGSFVDRFEADLAAYTGAKCAIAVSNGTAALHLSLLLAGAEPDDEVLVPALTFVATANAISYCRAIPHFVDVEERDPRPRPVWPSSCHLHRDRTAPASGDLPVTVRPVVPSRPSVADAHLRSSGRRWMPWPRGVRRCGLPGRRGRGRVAREHVPCGRHTGTFGLLGALSFNGNKIVTTGGGGAILTDDPELGAASASI